MEIEGQITKVEYQILLAYLFEESCGNKFVAKIAGVK